MPVKAPPLVAAWSWAGFYVGGHVGAARGRSNIDAVTDTVNGTFPGFVTLGGIPGLAPIVGVPNRIAPIGGVTGRDTDFLGGGQVGFNWQQGAFVFGVEGDVSATRLNPSATVNHPDPFAIATLTGTYATQIDWIASLRLRAGRAFDRTLVYVTGGAAVAHGSVDSTFTLTNPITGIFFPAAGSSGTTTASSSFTKLGWTAGAGIEMALWTNWSIAAEYRHSGFGKKSITLATTDPSGALEIVPQQTNMRLAVDQVTVRANWRFNPP